MGYCWTEAATAAEQVQEQPAPDTHGPEEAERAHLAPVLIPICVAVLEAQLIAHRRLGYQG